MGCSVAHSALPVVEDVAASAASDGERARGASKGTPSQRAAEQEWSLTLHKRQGDVLGAGLGNADTGAVIFNIQEGGLFYEWNKANRLKRLYPGLTITEVNGVTGYWAILEELRMPGKLAMRVSTRPPANAGPRWFDDIAAAGRSLEAQGPSGGTTFMLRLQQDGGFGADSQFSSLPSVAAGDCGVDQCAICLDDVSPDTTLLQLPCKHAFHPVCAARWLTQAGAHARGKRHCCPLCCRRVQCTPDGRVVVADSEEVRG